MEIWDKYKRYVKTSDIGQSVRYHEKYGRIVAILNAGQQHCLKHLGDKNGEIHLSCL